MATYDFYLDGSNYGYYYSPAPNNGVVDTVNINITNALYQYGYYKFMGDAYGASDTFNVYLPSDIYVGFTFTGYLGASIQHTLILYDSSGYRGVLVVNGNLNVIPFCFTAGAMIDTPEGPRRVETLEEGDLVLTRDSGARPVRWIGRSRMTAETLRQHPHLRPVRIAAGTLGRHDEQLVSPCHRMLVSDWRAETLFGEAEVLVAARELVNDGAIAVAHDLAEVEYIHLMFDSHELVRVGGAWSESFHPAGLVTSDVAKATHDEVLAIFPELEGNDPATQPTVRAPLSSDQVKVLADFALQA